MNLRIQKLNSITETEFKNWQERLAALNRSSAHRFGIYDDAEFVGEFNFVFGSSVLLKKEPKTAWIAIGIGAARCRGFQLNSERDEIFASLFSDWEEHADKMIRTAVKIDFR